MHSDKSHSVINVSLLLHITECYVKSGVGFAGIRFLINRPKLENKIFIYKCEWLSEDDLEQLDSAKLSDSRHNKAELYEGTPIQVAQAKRETEKDIF